MTDKEHEAKRIYLMVLSRQLQAMKMCLEDILSAYARMPESAVTPEWVVTRILRTGFMPDILGHIENEFFRELFKKFKDGEMEAVGQVCESAFSRALYAESILRNPVPLIEGNKQ